MAFDGIVTKSIASELQQLSGARIDKIFQPNSNSVILGFYLSGNNYALNICIDLYKGIDSSCCCLFKHGIESLLTTISSGIDAFAIMHWYSAVMPGVIEDVSNFLKFLISELCL